MALPTSSAVSQFSLEIVLYHVVFILCNYFYLICIINITYFLKKFILLILNISNPPVLVALDYYFLIFILFFLCIYKYNGICLFILSQITHWKTITCPELCCGEKSAYLQCFPRPICELRHPGLSYPGPPDQTPSVSRGASCSLCSSDTGASSSVVRRSRFDLREKPIDLPGCLFFSSCHLYNLVWWVILIHFEISHGLIVFSYKWQKLQLMSSPNLFLLYHLWIPAGKVSPSPFSYNPSKPKREQRLWL